MSLWNASSWSAVAPHMSQPCMLRSPQGQQGGQEHEGTRKPWLLQNKKKTVQQTKTLLSLSILNSGASCCSFHIGPSRTLEFGHFLLSRMLGIALEGLQLERCRSSYVPSGNWIVCIAIAPRTAGRPGMRRNQKTMTGCKKTGATSKKNDF